MILDEEEVKYCRKLIRQTCHSKDNCKKTAMVMKSLGYSTVEDILVLMFAKDILSQEKID